MFTKEFCESLPPEPLNAAEKLVDEFFEIASSFSESDKIQFHGDYIHAVYALKAYCSANGLDNKLLSAVPEFNGDKQVYANEVTKWFAEARKRVQTRISAKMAEESELHYSSLFKNDHVVELTDGEYRRIQDLIDQLRKFLTESTVFDEKHKNRLLARLEKLQQELHKTMSNVDRFWGFLNDAGMALGRFGEDAKPMFDRAREMVEVLYGAQHRTLRLPGPAEVPQLPDYSGDGPT